MVANQLPKPPLFIFKPHIGSEAEKVKRLSQGSVELEHVEILLEQILKQMKRMADSLEKIEKTVH